MPHGIDAYFDDLARQRRRTGTCAVIVAILAIGIELALMPRAVVETLNDPRRWGYEGRDQYVRRILLETVGPVEQPGRQAQNVVAVELRAGGSGGEGGARVQDTGTTPSALRGGSGAGDDPMDLRARLRALALQGPIIRSEELVVERLVRPEYPDAARDAGIEGVVEMVARVDTTGAVTEVHIVGGTRQPLLEQAATTAVLQCLYRPYRVHESAESVWAYFRVSFTLY